MKPKRMPKPKFGRTLITRIFSEHITAYLNVFSEVKLLDWNNISEFNFSRTMFVHRFRPEKRDQIDPMHFMPFGVGPRHCVGMRLALMEMKMSVVHILQRFKLITCSETQVRVNVDNGTPGNSVLNFC